ncbi:hypothetical protein BJ741DRAFT_580520 [Chytriomyces cf. hyalinus JEL632]|nr:hypothetical protein BJ741DRAFT_580520 [Chytriomyces cf. hyalinus JEL632]
MYMHPIVLVLFLVSGALAYECRCMCGGRIYAESNSNDCGNYCAATIAARGGRGAVCPNGPLTWQVVNGSSSYYHNRWPVGAYAGLCLGILALVAGVFVAVWFCRRPQLANTNFVPQPAYLNPVHNSNAEHDSSPPYDSNPNQKPPSSHANQQTDAPVVYPAAPISYAEPSYPPPGFHAPPSQPPPNQQSLGTYQP